jgi:phosphopantothenoylcysteine decarboxylase/phosphopantothenate--cysteine ligase
MGYALAQAATDAGAEVTLISGPVAISEPEVSQVIHVETAQNMRDSVLDHIVLNNIYIASAAVADYTPETVSSSKIKKSAKTITVELRKTEDILTTVAASDYKIFTVGFAAETNNLEQYARSKLVDKHLNMIIANQVGLPDRGFDSDNNAVTVFWENGHQAFSLQPKKQLATDLIELIAQHYAK